MSDLEKELRESIAYFEQILSVLPEDRTALDFLSVATAQLGDREKALKYAIALSEVVLRDKDAEDAAEVIEKLSLYDDPQAKAAVLKLKVLVAPPPELKFERPVVRDASAAPKAASEAEIALLDRLVEDGVLHKTLVRSAYDQLENLPSSDVEFLISALLILEKENLTGAADALAAVADAAHAPPIALDAFDVAAANLRLLPERLVKVRGVVPFAKIGGEWAVAVLNPLDEALRIEVSEAMGVRCHFFLAVPSTVEKVLSRIYRDEAMSEAEQAMASSDAEPVSAEPPPVTNPIH